MRVQSGTLRQKSAARDGLQGEGEGRKLWGGRKLNQRPSHFCN